MRISTIEIPDIIAAAIAVCCNLYGIGDERIKNLKDAGYDPSVVQQCVNELFPIFKKYGG